MNTRAAISTILLLFTLFCVDAAEPSRGEVFQWLRQARGAAIAGEKDKARKLIDDARSWASRNKDKLAAAWAEQLAGEVEVAAGDRVKATTAFTAALEAFTEMKNDQGIANCRLNLGRLAFADGKFSDAQKHQAEALAVYEKLNRPAEKAAALADLAASLHAMGKIAEAKDAWQKALAIVRDRATRDAAAELRVRAQLGAVSNDAEAVKHLTAAIELAVELKQPAEEARVRNSLGAVYQRQSNLDEARKQYDAALKATGEPSIEATIRNNLGALLQDQGKGKEALEELNKALALFTKQSDDAGQGRALYNIALVHEADGRNDEAIAAYEKALTLRRKLKDDAGTARVLDNLSLLYAAAGKADKAKECRDEAERLRARR